MIKRLIYELRIVIGIELINLTISVFPNPVRVDFATDVVEFLNYMRLIRK